MGEYKFRNKSKIGAKEILMLVYLEEDKAENSCRELKAKPRNLVRKRKCTKQPNNLF